MEVYIKSLEDLENFAKAFASCLKGNELILLNGNLAAGKTTLTKMVVSAIDETLKDEVISPTFTILNEYITPKFPVYHVDLYRVKNFDLDDFYGKGVIFVEWAEYQDFNGLDVPVVEIFIDILEDEKRLFKINGDKRFIECLKEKLGD